MIIRQEQLAFLTEASRDSFEHRVAEHLRRCFPQECKALGSQGIEGMIRVGIGRAGRHGINLERDVCKYIDLMFVFGRDFDARPELGWASCILEDPELTNSTIKMDSLFAAARKHIAEQWQSLAS